MTEPRYGIGDSVVLFSAGLGRVVAFASRDASGKPAPWIGGPQEFFVVEVADKVAFVPLDRADETLRPPMERQAAQRAVDILCGPAEELTLEPLVDRGRRVAHGGDPLDAARLLRDLMGVAPPWPDVVASGVAFFRRLLFPEVAAGLGVSEGELLERIGRRGPG